MSQPENPVVRIRVFDRGDGRFETRLIVGGVVFTRAATDEMDAVRAGMEAQGVLETGAGMRFRAPAGHQGGGL